MMGEVIRVSGRVPDVGDLLREAMVSQRFADVSLCCSGGQRFLAHRLVLSAASPYLQEVLLAHGKAAGYGEPITMILADVEGPELSAILGFVYTGSATIPKSRLEAFTRAAETLHLTIPKFTIPSACARPNYVLSASRERSGAGDCEQFIDNVKSEIKTLRNDVRYLSCEQYPCNDDWSSSSWQLRDDCSMRRDLENCDDWLIARSDKDIARRMDDKSDANGGSMGLDVEMTKSNFHRSRVVDDERHFRYEKMSKFRRNESRIENDTTMKKCETFREGHVYPWPEKSATIANAYHSLIDDGSAPFAQNLEKPSAYRNRVHPGVRNFFRFGVETCEPLSPDNFVSRMTTDSSRVVHEVTGEQRKDHTAGDFEGSPDENASSRLTRCTTTGARSSVTFEKQDYDNTTMTMRISARVAPGDMGTPLVAAKSETAVSSSILNCDANTNFSSTMGVTTRMNASGARDSCCGEICCAWRSPRRHVANRVPASPWCQLARPAHHSPKTRPHLPRNQNEIVDPAPPSRLDWSPSFLPSDTRRPSTFSPPLTPTPSTTPMLCAEKRSENTSSSYAHSSDDDGNNNELPLSSHGFQVPKIMENNSTCPRQEGNPSMAITAASPMNLCEDTRSYGKSAAMTVPIVAMEQYPPVIITSKDAARGNEKSVMSGDTDRELESLSHRQIGEASGIIVYHEQSRVSISQHAISPARTAVNKQIIISESPTCNPPSTTTRIELSHPISRLCDSVSKSSNEEPVKRTETTFTDETVGNNVSSTAPLCSTKATVETRPEDNANFHGKTILSMSMGIIVRSDDNNNEARIDETCVDSNARNVDQVGLKTVVERIANEDAAANNDEHRCDQCGKSFVTRASLKVHVRTHSGEKPFRCNDCGKEFSQLRNYKYHRSVHEGTREFAATCPECGKYFNDRGYLSSHMKIHRNRKEYACTDCGKSFNQRVAYNMHVRIHTGVKPHQCEQCGKAFSRKMLLKQHLRTHSGERPYQCQICHKAFADRSNMTLHTRLHSGLKPYQCTLCAKAFTKKHHLKTHLNYHTGTKPYSCPNCSLRFSQSSNMRTHYKKCCATIIDNRHNEQQRVDEESGTRRNKLGVSSLGEDEPQDASSRGGEAPSVGARTNALTPPSSDQESSNFQTPTKLTNVIALRTRSTKNLDITDANRVRDT